MPADLAIKPRAEWAGDLRPTGPLDVERPEDVRFLLVHHTASPNDYDHAEVPALLRSFYTMHVGPERKWPDIAYNFLVDAYGGVWEGREGSATMPVKGSATGGSQGFAMLCCYIGNYTARAPSPAAEAAMLALLARLADRYGVDTTPGATAQFVSRGSNRHPEGTSVTTRTISGHRDMSKTECPGEVVYAAVRDRYQGEVTALRAALAAAPSPSAQPTVTPDPARDPSSASASPGEDRESEMSQRVDAGAEGSGDEDDSTLSGPAAVTVAAVGATAAVAGAVAVRARGGTDTFVQGRCGRGLHEGGDRRHGE